MKGQRILSGILVSMILLLLMVGLGQAQISEPQEISAPLATVGTTLQDPLHDGGSRSLDSLESQNPSLTSDRPSIIVLLASPSFQASYVYHTFLQSPEGMEFGPDGNLYVADWLGTQIARISPSGEMTTVIENNYQGHGPADVAFAQDGTLYFSDLRSIYAFVDGSAILKRRSSDTINRIAFGPDGNLYFTEWLSGDVMRLLSSGTTEVISTGLDNPDDLAFNAAGELLVSEWATQRIVRVDVSTGNVTGFAAAPSGPGDPLHLALESDGDLWAHGNGTLLQFDSTGAMIPFTLNDSDPSAVFAVGGVGGIAFDDQGNLWVGASPHAKITRIEPTVPGGPITDTATITLVVPGFNPRGIAVGPTGDIYAADSAGPPLEPGQVLRISPSGDREVFVTLAGAAPHGIAVDRDGNIFLSVDILNEGGLNRVNRILKVTAHGAVSDYVTNVCSRELAIGSDGYLYALLPHEGKILKITGAETYTEFFTGLGDDTGHKSIAAAPDGGLYMAMGLTGEVWYLPQTGNSHTVIASIPTLIGNPNAIAVTPSGDVFVQTHNNYHLWRITKEGALVDYADRVFNDPNGLAISLDERSVYVSRGGSIDRIPIVDQFLLPLVMRQSS